MRERLLLGDCMAHLPTLFAESVDALVTDPPYELGFMDAKWDKSGIAYSVELWALCLRALKPGAHALIFGSPRTYHRMACAVEDAGFEVRDQIEWLYGQGFPKSSDVSKQLDKRAGAKRRVIGQRETGAALSRMPSGVDLGTGGTGFGSGRNLVDVTEPESEDAKRWEGWGSALKPAHEPILLARKPIIDSIAENVQSFGSGALNIDACRIGLEQRFSPPSANKSDDAVPFLVSSSEYEGKQVAGRWPANLVLDDSEVVQQAFPMQHSGGTPARRFSPKTQSVYGDFNGAENPNGIGSSDGSAARFFYCAKVSMRERERGLAGLERHVMALRRVRNHHPTVKPLELMRYLVKLVTPAGGIVLDPFMGSGSTGMACMLERRRFIGIEREAEFFEIARRRIAFAHASSFVGELE